MKTITSENKKRVFILFCMLQIAYWGCFATFLSYFSAFMLANGMSNTVLSLILSIYLLAAFLGSFFWGSLSDRLGTNRITFLIQIGAGLITGLLIYRFAKVTALVAVLYPVLGFAMVPVASNLDSWILKSFPQDPDYYGVTRGMSALGFGILALIMGQLVGTVGYHIMPIGLTIFAVLAIVIAVIQPDSPKTDGLVSAKFSIKDVGGLFRIRPYLILILVLFLTGLTIVPISNLKITLYQSVGGDVKWVGYDSFIGCMIQFPIFMMAGKLKRIRPSFRLFLSLLGPAMLLIFYFIGNIPQVVIIGSVFYFLGYSILLPTYRELGASLVEPKLMTTAQSLLDAVFSSLAGMTGLLYSGYVIDNYGLKTLIALGMIIFIIPMATVTVQYLKDRKK